MILCVNLNAAIDKTALVSPFRLNAIHRPQKVMALPGGKGCNVARAIQLLGETPVVTGWVGGFAGQFIEAGLRTEGIQTDFVRVEAESRTCLSIVDADAGTLTELYEKGEPIPADKIEAFSVHFQSIIGSYQAVTLSGSVPPGVPSDFYARLIAIAKSANVPVLLDASGEALKNGIGASPLLIKPNKQEFLDLVGKDSDLSTEPLTLARFRDAVESLYARTHIWIILSLGADGVIARDGQHTIHVQPPPITVQSAVGSGDCVLAGIAYGLTHEFSFADAVCYGVAAGTANALTLGAGKFTLADFAQIRQNISLTVI